MADLSKFGNIHKIESNTDEFDVIRTDYVANISFKSFDVPAVPLAFNLPSVNSDGNSKTWKSLDIPVQADSIKFAFQLEDDGTLAGRGWKNYKLFMKVIDEELGMKPKYVEVVALTECPCNARKSLNPACYTGHSTLVELMPSSPVEIFSHKHEFTIQEIPGIITVKFTVIDISRATLAPLGVLKLIAKRNCKDALEPLSEDWENNPHDIIIKCKENYKLVAHKAILMARSPALRSRFQLAPEVTELNAPESSPFAMKVILHYIYSGTLQEDWMKDVNGVIDTARQFRLLELIELFEHLIVNACTIYSAFAFYLLAKRHSLNHAQRSIQNKYLFVEEMSVGISLPESYYYQSNGFERCFDMKSIEFPNKKKTL